MATSTPSTAEASNRSFWLVVAPLAAASALLVALIFLNRPAAERASEFTARDNLRAALDAAQAVRQEEGTFAAATALRLRGVETDLLFIDPDQASNNPEVISVFASGSVWAAAARAGTGACFWVRARPDRPTAFGTGTDCSGEAASTRGAGPEGWPSP